MKSVRFSKPGLASITCSKISNIPYNLIFTTKFNSSILITIISWNYLNLFGGSATMSYRYNYLAGPPYWSWKTPSDMPTTTRGIPANQE
jgi:hypothetical protein